MEHLALLLESGAITDQVWSVSVLTKLHSTQTNSYFLLKGPKESDLGYDHVMILMDTSTIKFVFTGVCLKYNIFPRVTSSVAAALQFAR